MANCSKNARAIFWEAAEKLDQGDRDRYLNEVCGDDPKLRFRIERMLEVQNSPDDCFMRVPAPELLGVSIFSGDQPIDESWIGTTIDRYRLKEKLGEGGMGAVFLAIQDQPVQREVALKIIKSGLANEEVAARFNVERRALALMDHPNIARVFDGGTTDSGSPYLVMELVRGEPITECCDRKKLDIHSRIRTFIRVCEAIQHAHQKGIIHCDLKPSNVLLKDHEPEPVPKVIDFGVAKPIDVTQLEMATVTRYSQIIGTPMYMSPEQTSGVKGDLDTRSDVYSLGVILYELLTGITPFGKERFRDSSPLEIQHLIREVDPPLPSARLQMLEPVVRSEIAENRSTTPSSLIASLKKELDWITMRALEKAPARRYQSPHELALDLQRYLNQEPVVAGPISMAYRAKKLAQRHWQWGLAACLAGIVLVIGAFICILLANQAWKAQRLAVENLQAANLAKLRFQTLAWRSGIERAYQSFELGQIEEAENTLNQLVHEVPEAKSKPEWQLLRNEMQRIARKLLDLDTPIHEVRLAPNTSHLLAAGGDGKIYVVDWKTSELLRTISTAIPSLHALAISHDGQRAAVGGVVDPDVDKAIPSIYDLQTGRLIAELPAHSTTIETLEFTSDDKKLVCGSRYEPIQIVTLESQAITYVPCDTRNQWLALSPDDELLVSLSTVPLSRSSSIQLTGLSPAFASQSLDLHSPIIRSFWLPGTTRLVSLQAANGLLVVDPLEPVRLLELIGARDAECFAMGPDRRVMAAGLSSGEVVVWRISPQQASEITKRTEDRELKPALDENGSIEPIAVAPFARYRIADGPITSMTLTESQVFVSSSSGVLRVIEIGEPERSVLESHQTLTTLEIASTSWQPDGQSMLIGTHAGAILKSQNLVDMEEVNPRVGKHVTAITASPDQKAMAWVRYRGDVSLLHGEKIRTLQVDSSEGENSIADENSIFFSPDSRRIAWYGNQHLHVASVDEFESSIRRFKMPGVVDCIAWTKNGGAIFLGGRHSQINRIDYDTGDVSVVADVGSYTGALILSEDGETLFSGHEDGSIRYWNLSGENSRMAYFHRSPIRAIALSRDRRLGACADKEGNVVLWFIDNCERIGAFNSQPLWAGLLRLAKPSLIFTENDTQLRILFELPERRHVLRTWDLVP